MRSIEQAASIIYQRPAIQAYGAPFPYPDFFSFILQLVQALTQCQPRPSSAYEFLTYRPGFWSLITGRYAERLAAYRAKVEVQMAVRWPGTHDAFRAFADSVWDAVDGGHITANLVEGCYADARS